METKARNECGASNQFVTLLTSNRLIEIYAVRSKWGMVLFAFALVAMSTGVGGAPLTTLRYEIVGTQLKVSPGAVSVPKGVAGSVLVEISPQGIRAFSGAYVEATLRGPSFEARKVVGPPKDRKSV